MGKDRNLFWQLVEEEHEAIRAYCFRLAGNETDGDDLYQDSILKAYNGFEQLKRIESFRYWLYKIVNNNYKGKFRKGWWKNIFRLSNLEELPWSTDPSDAYEARRRVGYALDRLNPDERIMIVLSEMEGWKISELAEIYSKSEGTIKMRLMRARNKMRKRLAALNKNYKSSFNAKESVRYEMWPGTKDSQ